jgi:hypothetical protein
MGDLTGRHYRIKLRRGMDFFAQLFKIARFKPRQGFTAAGISICMSAALAHKIS